MCPLVPNSERQGSERRDQVSIGGMSEKSPKATEGVFVEG
jgi:hypothetical protein